MSEDEQIPSSSPRSDCVESGGTAHSELEALKLLQHETNSKLLMSQALVKELESRNAELSASLQQREDFVAALMHDLKNPLIGSIRIFEFLKTGDATNDQLISIYDQLSETNKHMLRMIWNLLDVYKHESGLLIPVYEMESVPALLDHCLEEFAFQIERKKISLNMRVPDVLPKVQTDRILLRRVLINLFDNALKFTPDNGSLTISIFQKKRTISISIKDSGKGMTELEQNRIFERFWQTAAGRENGLGTGLGLFLSKQIVSTLGGSIACISAQGKGTEFIVCLEMDH
jgi:signal transduction histidine kinase